MFELKKIVGGRINVPEPEEHIAGAAITAGMALTLSGTLAKASGTTVPTHIALADAAANEKVACYAVLPGMVFEVPVSAAPTSLKEGQKVTINSDGLKVTATTTDGIATIVNLNGAAAADDTIMVKF